MSERPSAYQIDTFKDREDEIRYRLTEPPNDDPSCLNCNEHVMLAEIDRLRAENERLTTLADGRLAHFQQSEESRLHHFQRAEQAIRWAVRLEQQLAAVDRERRKVLASSILSQDTSALRDGAVGMTKTFTCDNCGGVFPMGDEDAAQAELADTFSGVSSANCAMVCDACYEEMLA